MPDYGAQPRPSGPRCPTKPAGRAPRAGGAAAALLSSALGTSRVPPSAAFRSRSAVRHAPGCYSTGDGPIIGSDHAFAHSAISKPCRITGLDRGPPSMPELVETKQQVEGLCISLNAGHGPTPRARARIGPVGAGLRRRGPAGLRRPRPRKVFPKLSLHRQGSSRIVLLRTGA